jgi:SAM-dependent methyltransferase
MSSSKLVVWGATDRNKDPIGDVLTRHLRREERVLEIASGTGQHAAYFCARFHDRVRAWQPTELDSDMFESIEAYRASNDNVIQEPLKLNCAEDEWPLGAGEEKERWTFVGVVNLMHISPKRVFDVFFERAASVTKVDALVYVYGPFKEDGKFSTESNERFDANLKQRNAEWGYRDAEQLIGNAKQSSFALIERNEMPANNLCFVFQKSK